MLVDGNRGKRTARYRTIIFISSFEGYIMPRLASNFDNCICGVQGSRFPSLIDRKAMLALRRIAPDGAFHSGSILLALFSCGRCPAPSLVYLR